jgi:hypothetical protein
LISAVHFVFRKSIISLTAVMYVQRNTLQNCIYKYAEELPAASETDLSEEESLWMELMVMIDRGHFSEDDVTIDMFQSATVQNGNFPIKCKHEPRGQKEDCWVLVAERRSAGADAGQHDLWLHCAAALARVRWTSPVNGQRNQFKLIVGSGQRLNAVQTHFGSTVFNEGKWEFEEHSTSADVDIVPAMLRADMDGQMVFKPDMVTPIHCAVCTCVEMEVPGEECIYVPCLKLGSHG